MAPISARKPKRKKPEVEETEVNDDDAKPGCIYIGSIPHGFYEEEMKSYFSQFGHVLAVRLVRSSKTGNSRGFGFVKFKYAAVAKTVAETCNNYLFFNKLLKCSYKPLSEMKKNAFKPLRWKPSVGDRMRNNNAMTEEQIAKSFTKGVSRATKKMEKFKSLGVDFNLQDVMDVPEVMPVVKKAKPEIKLLTKMTEERPKRKLTKESEIVVGEGALAEERPKRKLTKESEIVVGEGALAAVAVEPPRKRKRVTEPEPELESALLSTEDQQKMSEESQKPPKQPKTPKSAKVLDQPKTPKSPKALDQPKTPKSPKALDQPKTPKSPKALDQPKTPKSPKTLDQPKTPKSPKALDQPKTPKSPKGVDKPTTPKSDKVLDKLKTLQSLKKSPPKAMSVKSPKGQAGKSPKTRADWKAMK